MLASYLAYTLYEAAWTASRAGTLHSLLSLPRTADSRAIQSRFRRLTLQHHPDKLRGGADADATAAAQAFYVRLTLARDTLLDPLRRAAYERFGEGAVGVAGVRCLNERACLVLGARSALPWYTGSAIAMLALGWLGVMPWGKYWRWWALAAMAALEVWVVTRASPVVGDEGAGGELSWLGWTPWLPFQFIAIARQATVALFIALARLGPLLAQGTSGEADGEVGVARALSRLESFVAGASMEAVRLLQLELVPFRGRAAAPRGASSQGAGAGATGQAGQMAAGEAWDGELEGKLAEWMVGNAVRSDAEVRDAVTRAVARRMQEATGRSGDGDGAVIRGA